MAVQLVRVTRVERGSLGYELGLKPGTELLSVDGRELTDFLDWEFLTAEDRFVLLARDPTGEQTVEYDVERPEGLALGVELEPPHVRRCANRCDFCFVDGNPLGMRDALYIRDDDYRLSFRHGNFATLTNLKQADEDRIKEYHLSPLYVSVHATDPVVRRRLLRNPLAPDILTQLRDFGNHDIRCHTQIVLQPGLNDGDVLRQSLNDLYGLGPTVISVSVVPVGLTEFSKHHLVREPTAHECRESVQLLDGFADRALQERGSHWAYGSDELYIVARLALPPAARYDGFEQFENGVGAVRFLRQKVELLNAELEGMRIGVYTGTAMGRLMPQILPAVESATGAFCELTVLENDLFGPLVTTAGLLPGSAFVSALRDRADLDLALVPAEAVNDEGLFIDGMTLKQLMATAPLEVRISNDFVDALSDRGAIG
jgi:putative radical SAM enzyme (TIGR03279 family)